MLKKLLSIFLITSILCLTTTVIVTSESSGNEKYNIEKAITIETSAGTYSSVPIGTILYKYGTTTGYSWGSVTGTSLRVTYSFNLFHTYTVDGLYSVALQNSSGTTAIERGDSGGPVWRSDTGQNLLHGIVTAKISDTNTMYTTPIYYAQSQGFQPKLN